MCLRDCAYAPRAHASGILMLMYMGFLFPGARQASLKALHSKAEVAAVFRQACEGVAYCAFVRSLLRPYLDPMHKYRKEVAQTFKRRPTRQPFCIHLVSRCTSTPNYLVPVCNTSPCLFVHPGCGWDFVDSAWLMLIRQSVSVFPVINSETVPI